MRSNKSFLPSWARGTLCLWFALVCVLGFPKDTWAEKFESAEYGFAIEAPEGWQARPAVYEGVVATFWKEGSLATFHVIERDLGEAKTVADLEWKDLFAPKFDEILIRQESETMVGGEKARYCIYKIRPGLFKQQMEGKHDFKYMNYIVIHENRLYSITFKGLESSFGQDYSGFLESVRTIRFLDSQKP
ncbi:MAG TPA: hypothetical protein PK590_01185 [Candidatus Omnitrophota bacterium]|nr:hypothetical protein [Candidatus Omnitrophota bacterium]